jgi:hypothetical protein
MTKHIDYKLLFEQQQKLVERLEKTIAQLQVTIAEQITLIQGLQGHTSSICVLDLARNRNTLRQRQNH